MRGFDCYGKKAIVVTLLPTSGQFMFNKEHYFQGRERTIGHPSVSERHGWMITVKDFHQTMGLRFPVVLQA